MIACVLDSNAPVNSPMKLIATFRCGVWRGGGVTEGNCSQRGNEAFAFDSTAELSHPPTLPFPSRSPLLALAVFLVPSLRCFTCRSRNWIRACKISRHAYYRGRHCCNVSDLDLWRINPSRRGWAGTPAYSHSHSQHRHPPCLPIWDRRREQTTSTASSVRESIVGTGLTSDGQTREMQFICVCVCVC